MGLDMYLMKRTKGEKESSEQVAYWRKANQVREWMVRNTGYSEKNNLEMHLLTREQLVKLLNDSKKVIESPELAETVMPTKDGYFFGSTEYDEEYLEELKNTVSMVTDVLTRTNFKEEEICYLEWW